MTSATTISLTLTEVVAIVVGALGLLGSFMGVLLTAIRFKHGFEDKFKEAVFAIQTNMANQFATQDKSLALLQRSVTENSANTDAKLTQMSADIAALQRNYELLERKQQEDRLDMARAMERYGTSAALHHAKP